MEFINYANGVQPVWGFFFPGCFSIPIQLPTSNFQQLQQLQYRFHMDFIWISVWDYFHTSFLTIAKEFRHSVYWSQFDDHFKVLLKLNIHFLAQEEPNSSGQTGIITRHCGKNKNYQSIGNGSFIFLQLRTVTNTIEGEEKKMCRWISNWKKVHT